MILGFAQVKKPCSQFVGNGFGCDQYGSSYRSDAASASGRVLLDSTKPTAHTSMEISVGFSFEDYRFAFLPVLIWLVLSVLALYLSQESYCKNKILMKQTLDDQKSIQAKESMKTEDYFFNIHDLSRGIQRN